MQTKKKKRRLAQKITEHQANGKAITLWLMPNNTYLINIWDTDTYKTLQVFNSTKDQLTDDEMALKYEALKTEIEQGTAAAKEFVTQCLQGELFIDEDVCPAGSWREGDEQ